MKKYTVIAIATICLMASQANATITINFGAGTLLDQDGSTPVPDGSLVIAVADTLGNGVGGLTTLNHLTPTTAGSTFNGYFILTLPYTPSGGYFSGSVTSQPLTSPLATGQNVYLLWFPTLTPSDTTVGYSQTYGVLGGATASANSLAEGGSTWTIPSDGALVSMFADDANNFGFTSTADLTASFTSEAVPEPSSVMLVGMGLLGMVGLMRRRHS